MISPGRARQITMHVMYKIRDHRYNNGLDGITIGGIRALRANQEKTLAALAELMKHNLSESEKKG